MTDRRVEEKNHYDHRYFHEPEKSGKIAKIFDLVNANATEFFYKQVFNCKNHKSSGKILDYGCGTGVKSASLVDNDWHVIGIDISEKSIEAGKNILCDNPAIRDGLRENILC